MVTAPTAQAGLCGRADPDFAGNVRPRRQCGHSQVTSIWGQVTNDVAESRKISVDSLNAGSRNRFVRKTISLSTHHNRQPGLGLQNGIVYGNGIVRKHHGRRAETELTERVQTL